LAQSRDECGSWLRRRHNSLNCDTMLPGQMFDTPETPDTSYVSSIIQTCCSMNSDPTTRHRIVLQTDQTNVKIDLGDGVWISVWITYLCISK